MPDEASGNETNYSSLNKCNPHNLADLLRKAGLGDLLAKHLPQHYHKQNPDAAGANAYNLATLDVIVLPDNQKAQNVLRGYARAAGTGTPGELTVDPPNTTPGAGDIAVTPSGDIAFLASEVWTDVDFSYQPVDGEVVESYFPVASDTLTLPVSVTTPGVILAAEVEAVEGTATGKKIILAPGGSPNAGQCALNLAKSAIAFAGADAVTRARVKLVVARSAAKQLHTVLNAPAIT